MTPAVGLQACCDDKTYASGASCVILLTHGWSCLKLGRIIVAMPFPYSMRSLQMERYRLALIGLIASMVLLLAWMAWFFTGRLTLYETGRMVHLTRQGAILAQFPQAARLRIQRGQTARLRLVNAAGDATFSLPAVVSQVIEIDEHLPIGVELHIRPDPPALRALRNGAAGAVAIAVDRATPAALLARAAQRRRARRLVEP